MVVDEADDEMQLDVGRGEVGPRLQESAGLRKIGGDHTAPPATVNAERSDEACKAPHRIADQIGGRRFIGEYEIGMILEVAADRREIMERRDSVRFQRLGVADPGQHQNLRRGECAGRKDHLAQRSEDSLLTFDEDLGADRALALEQDAQSSRASLHAKIGAPAHVGMDIGSRGAATLAIDLGDLIEAATLLLGAVEIAIERQLGFADRVEKQLLEAVVRA
jgi:hypothetical protein